MKKVWLAIIMICLMGSLAACGDKKPTMETEKNTKEISTEVDDSTSEKVSEEKTETEEAKETEEIKETEETKETEEKEQQEKQELPQLLTLMETRNARYEGINDYERMLLISKF
ncbi:MAG: hypothetical protein E7287_09035, partial [Lachnospiraceae bacterium]|nr:hypothetical protein [Lachnospiraceae bacterium]